MKRLLLATAVAMLSAGAANAAIIPVLDSVTDNGTDFTFTYSGTLAPDAGVINGSQLVIFDFAGFTGFGDLSSNITATTEATTTVIPEPGAVLFPSPGFDDDPGVLNLVFTYTGPAFHNSGGPFTPIDFKISANSIFQNIRLDGFSAITVKNNGPAVGTFIRDVGATAVPTGVPEPATWAMMILGFGGVGSLIRRRRESLSAA